MDHQQFLCAALCILTIFEICTGADTLAPNQTLADGEVLISPGQIYELGFFSPGSPTSRFMGIRYKATPDVVVWVANRERPIMGSQGVLALAKNGTLVLSTAQSTNIWSSISSRAASSPLLKLLDSGNLVIVDKATSDSSWPESYVWQSFDYPGDTFLPGMKMVYDPDAGEDKHFTSWRSAADPSIGKFSYRIGNQGLSQVIIMKGVEKVYRAIFWDGRFPGFPDSPYQQWKTEVATDRGRLISIYQPFSDSVKTRLIMNYSGPTQRYVMNEQEDGWILMLTGPRDMCDNYGLCGHNGICKINKTPVCECLRGFKPKSEEEWGNFNWSSGCTRNVTEDCQKEDGFLKVKGLKFPDSLNFRLNTSMSIGECRDKCLMNCTCSAYADPYFKNETSCLMWFGELIDTREQTVEAGGVPNIYIRAPLSEIELETDWTTRRRKGHAKMKVIFIAGASSFGMLILCLSIGGLLLKMRRKRKAYKKARKELELPLFDLATIAAATNNFSKKNVIGEGGFGPVYKGILAAEQAIAVKRMSKTSGQGSEEFKSEVILIAKLQHRNLVRILGCCIEGEEKMLIYDYMENKSLDNFIFDQERRALLTWPKRFDIVMGIARGLLYLHHDSRLKIIHRDLKTSNILLDEDLNAKISDFGLARMFEGDQTTARTKRVVGTYGYMAPEYAFDGKFSIKSDVFSLGVVILEIVSGKKNTGFKHPSYYQNLLEQAWLLWQENREMEMMDPCYKCSHVEPQIRRCIQIGLLCVQNAADDRPIMPSVILMLSTENALLPQPKKPGFFLQSSSSFSKRNTSASEKSSSATITMSDIEAR